MSIMMTLMTNEATKTVDLGALTAHRVDVHTLSGQDRGAAAREKFALDRLDNEGTAVEVVIPSPIRALSPSFLQGMLTKSIRTLGRDGFHSQYRFVTTRQAIIDQVDDVVNRVLGRA